MPHNDTDFTYNIRIDIDQHIKRQTRLRGFGYHNVTTIKQVRKSWRPYLFTFYIATTDTGATFAHTVRAEAVFKYQYDVSERVVVPKLHRVWQRAQPAENLAKGHGAVQATRRASGSQVLRPARGRVPGEALLQPAEAWHAEIPSHVPGQTAHRIQALSERLARGQTSRLLRARVLRRRAAEIQVRRSEPRQTLLVGEAALSAEVQQTTVLLGKRQDLRLDARAESSAGTDQSGAGHLHHVERHLWEIRFGISVGAHSRTYTNCAKSDQAYNAGRGRILVTVSCRDTGSSSIKMAPRDGLMRL